MKKSVQKDVFNALMLTIRFAINARNIMPYQRQVDACAASLLAQENVIQWMQLNVLIVLRDSICKLTPVCVALRAVPIVQEMFAMNASLVMCLTKAMKVF